MNKLSNFYVLTWLIFADSIITIGIIKVPKQLHKVNIVEPCDYIICEIPILTRNMTVLICPITKFFIITECLNVLSPNEYINVLCNLLHKHIINQLMHTYLRMCNCFCRSLLKFIYRLEITSTVL